MTKTFIKHGGSIANISYNKVCCGLLVNLSHYYTAWLTPFNRAETDRGTFVLDLGAVETHPKVVTDVKLAMAT